MIVNLVLAFAVAAGLLALAMAALRDHRAAMTARAGLLDRVVVMFPQATVAIGGDGFPVLTARLPDRRQVTMELVPDTLVTRRLPQLWLVVTLRERFDRPRVSIGALARPTGTEFYSRVQAFPDRVATPAELDPGLLLRGEGTPPPPVLSRAADALQTIFADPRVKEIAATPRGLRVVRQAAEGDRGSHLLLRQVRFLLAGIALETVTQAIADSDRLRAALDGPAEQRADRVG